jgi:putative flippase GtrA
MKMKPPELALWRRWLIFSLIGIMGAAIQMIALSALTTEIKLDYLLATAIAVEIAVIHNFFWHERWTWADRTRNIRDGLIRRFLCFQAANGVFSLASNILLMKAFVGIFHMHYLPANLLAITLCSILNFLAGDQIVFTKTADAGTQQREEQ